MDACKEEAKLDALQKRDELSKQFFELCSQPIDCGTVPSDWDKSFEEIGAATAPIAKALEKLLEITAPESSELRDLDTRLDEVDADIKLHQQVVQLKSYSSDCVGSFKSGDYSNATTKCVLFSKLFRSSTQESEDQRAKVVQMVGPQAVALQEKTKASLVELLLKDYNAGIKAANLQEICRVVPLLGDLDLATEAVGLYLKFVKKVLVDALNEATQSSDDSTSTKIAQTFNAAATVLRHHLPMVSQALGAAEGDRGLLQLVHLEVERRVLKLIQDMVGDLEDLKTVATIVPNLEDDLASWGRGEESSNEQALDLEEVDKACEECACLIQYIQGYDTFVKHCCSEVERASALRLRSRSGEEEDGEDKPSPPILPKTELEEAAIELGAILSGGEQALLLASIQLVLVSPATFEPYDENPRAQCSNYIEEIFYAAQKSAMRAIASGHEMSTCVVLNTCSNSLSMVMRETLKGKRTSKATQLLAGSRDVATAALENVADVASNINNLRRGGRGGEAEDDKAREKERKLTEAGAAFNDYTQAVQYFGRMQEVLMEEIENGGEEKIDAEGQLASSVKLFAVARAQLEEEDPLFELAAELGARVKSIVDRVGETEECNYEIDEQGYERFESTGGWLGAIMEEVERVVGGAVAWVGANSGVRIWSRVLDELMKRTEILIRKKRLSEFGCLQLDAEVRRMGTWARGLNGNGNGNGGDLGGTDRLKQIAKLVNALDFEDVRIMSSEPGWRLKKSEIRGYLQLRVDAIPNAEQLVKTLKI
ncbi:hypothetical protein TrVE_jg7472 [Triparma verrucosa]|uniref:COG4 transport protein middle alpha-helical bundle domain-containing protein n=1 Tax=Triparma verrucosa TaxID=1606542 RepID=A0A9W7C7H0_9STRA|nr:hypothetical protein TrVE_jg7472 [Triparma verrucosa]